MAYHSHAAWVSRLRHPGQQLCLTLSFIFCQAATQSLGREEPWRSS